MSGAQKTSAKTTNKQGQTFTQLAYALDDAQYGFRGVQNNLQAVAVSAGISGPIVLGITAMLIGIQQLITHWDSFGDIASKALKSINDEIAGSQGTVASVMIFADMLENNAESSDKFQYALKRLKDKGFVPLNGTIEEFIELLKQKAALEAFDTIASKRVADLQGKIVKEQFKYNQAIKDEIEAREAALSSQDPEAAGFYSGSITVAKSDQAEAKKAIGEIETEIKDFITAVNQTRDTYFPDGILAGLINPRGSGSGRDKLKSVLDFDLIDSTIEQGKEWQKYAKKIVEAFATEWNIAAKGAVLEVPGVDSIDAGLKATQARLGHNIQSIETTVKDAGATLSSAAASAFSGLGVAIGEALAGDGNFGEKFLKTLGTFMVQFGSALIALGIAEAAWLASFDPATKIIAGTALVIAGAAISSAYREKPGGGSSAQRSEVTSSTLAPSSVQGDGSGQAGWRLDGQDLVFALEAARSDRAAYS